jgi:hypothetical protein
MSYLFERRSLIEGTTEVTDGKWCLYDVNPREHNPVGGWCEGGQRVATEEERKQQRGQVIGYYWQEVYSGLEGFTPVLVGDYCRV